MFTRNQLRTIFLAGSITLSGATFAEPIFHSIPSDQGTVLHGAEFAVQNGKRVRLDNLNFNAAATSPGKAPRVGEISADGNFRYSGGEQGFVLIQHSYALAQGKLLHTDSFDHSQPKSATAVRSSTPAFVDLARGN